MTRTIQWNPDAVEVSFDELELRRLWNRAVERQRPKDQAVAARDKRVSSTDNVRMHYLGLKGEAAAGKVLGLPINLSTGISGRNFLDLVSDYKIEVKCQQGYLIFSHGGNSALPLDVDAIVLVTRTAKEATVNVQGWTTPAHFMAHYFVDDFGYGETFCMQPAALFPIKSLISAISLRTPH